MFNFNFGIDTYEVIFEVYVGNQLTNRQKMKAPKEMIMMNFLQTVEQIKNDTTPIKIKMIKNDFIWDKFENKQKTIENYIEFTNNTMGD